MAHATVLGRYAVLVARVAAVAVGVDDCAGVVAVAVVAAGSSIVVAVAGVATVVVVTTLCG